MLSAQTRQGSRAASRDFKMFSGIRLALWARAFFKVSPAGNLKDHFDLTPGGTGALPRLRESNFVGIIAFAGGGVILPFLLLLLLIFNSCASQAAVSGGRVEAFASIGDVVAVWESLGDGVGFFRGKIAAPRLEFFALRVDLFAPGIEIVVKGGGGSDQSLSMKVSGFVRDNGLLAGINAVPFDVVSSQEGQPLKNMGIVISNGKLISPANPRYDALVFFRQPGLQSAAIVSQSAINSLENIENAAGGFHRILIAGEPAQRTFNNEAAATRHPRSAAGISSNGKYLYLLVIDGRRAGSIGATEMETALLLRSLNSHDAINLDGGGSSALALRGGKIVNTPIHGRIPGRERAVAGCIGINISTEK